MYHVCMYVSCMSCIKYASCMACIILMYVMMYVSCCIMYVSCMYHVSCIMCIFSFSSTTSTTFTVHLTCCLASSKWACHFARTASHSRCQPCLTYRHSAVTVRNHYGHVDDCDIMYYIVIYCILILLFTLYLLCVSLCSLSSNIDHVIIYTLYCLSLSSLFPLFLTHVTTPSQMST